jgi:hypothetical protein
MTNTEFLTDLAMLEDAYTRVGGSQIDSHCDAFGHFRAAFITCELYFLSLYNLLTDSGPERGRNLICGGLF